MKKQILIIAILFGVFQYSNAQVKDGDLSIVKSRIYQDGRLLKPKEVLSIMQSNPEAFNAFKKAKSNYDAANVFGFIGGFMIGWPLGSALGGGEPQWGIAAGGAAVLLLGIPLSRGYQKHARNAIDIYNKNDQPSTSLKTSVNMNFTGTGVKFTVKF